MYNYVLKNYSHHPQKWIIRFHSNGIFNPIVIGQGEDPFGLGTRILGYGTKWWGWLARTRKNSPLRNKPFHVFRIVFDKRAWESFPIKIEKYEIPPLENFMGIVGTIQQYNVGQDICQFLIFTQPKIQQLLSSHRLAPSHFTSYTAYTH